MPLTFLEEEPAAQTPEKVGNLTFLPEGQKVGNLTFLDEPAEPAVPESGLLESAGASTRRGVYETAAAATDIASAVANRNVDERVPFNPADKHELNQARIALVELERKSKELYPQTGHLSFKHPTLGLTPDEKKKALALQSTIERLTRNPGWEEAARNLRQEGKASFDIYGANPESQNPAAQVGRGIGSVVSAGPFMAAGLPAAVAQMTGTAYEGARQAKEDELRAKGVTDEDVIRSQAEGVAKGAAIKSAAAMSAYMLGGKFAGSLAARLAGPNASSVAKALFGFGGAEIANVGTGSVIRALEANPGDRLEAAVPKIENLTADTLFAVFHGLGEYTAASKSARAKAEAEMKRRGFSKEEIDPPTPPESPVGGAPASEIKTEGGKTPAEAHAAAVAVDASESAERARAAGLGAAADALDAKAAVESTPPPAPAEEPAPLPGGPASGTAGPPAEAPEKVTAAALKFPDGQITTGRVHGFAWDQADAAGLTERQDVSKVESGFVTNKGRFITREEANQLSGTKDRDAEGLLDGKVRQDEQEAEAAASAPAPLPDPAHVAEIHRPAVQLAHDLAAPRPAAPEGGAEATPAGFEKPEGYVMPEPVSDSQSAGLPIIEAPLDNVTLSTDVPQFKAGANSAGVVEPLQGKFDRTGVGPVQLWRRLDGRLELISGRHRFDLAQRSGEKTIPAQVHDEAEGFDVQAAARLDAELNIRDNQGETSDYANYFRNTPDITEEDAQSRGLLARSKGRAGFRIARDASEDVFALHQSKRLSDAQAEAVAAAAPGNDAAQRLGVRAMMAGAGIADAANAIRAAVLSSKGETGVQGDFFSNSGLEEQWLKQGKVASDAQRSLREDIASVQGAAKKPALAKKYGVDVKDPEGVQKKVAELRGELARWENWPSHPDLVAKTKGEEPPAPKAEPVEEPPAPLNEDENPSFFASKNREGDRVTKSYNDLVDKTGYPAVSIGELQAASGIPMADLHKMLVEAWRRGDAVFSSGDFSLSPQITKDGALITPTGDRVLQVRFQDLKASTDSSPEASLRGRLREAIDKAPAESDVTGAPETLEFPRPGATGKIIVQNTKEALQRLADKYRPSREEHHAAVEKVAKELEESTGLKIHVWKNEFEAPKELQARLERGSIHEGVVDLKAGEVHLFSENLKTPERAREVVLHEAKGHYGVQTVLPYDHPAWQKIADTVFRTAPTEANAIAADYVKKHPRDFTPADRAKIALEYVARLAEKPEQNPTVWRRIVSEVRNALRKLGIVKDWTEEDIKDLLRRGGEALKSRARSESEGVHAAVKDLPEDIKNLSPYSEHVEQAFEKAVPDEGERKAIDEWVRGKIAGTPVPELSPESRNVAERFLGFFRDKQLFAQRNGVARYAQQVFEARMSARPGMSLTERLATYDAEVNRLASDRANVRGEASAGEKDPTSIKNEVVDKEREAAGLPPAMEPARKEFGTVWESAMNRMSRDPDAGRDLVDSLIDRPRIIGDEDNAILLHRQITLQNEFHRVVKDAISAREAGNDAAAEEHTVRSAYLQDQLQRLYDVGKRVGTEQGRALNIRKMLANEDYTLATMTAKARDAESGGRPLSAKFSNEVQAWFDNIVKTKEAADVAEAADDATRAGTAASESLKDIVKKVRPRKAKTEKAPGEVPPASEKTKSWIEKQAEAARERINQRRGKMHADPFGVMTAVDLADRVIVGAADIAGGLRDFAGWAAKQLREFGEAIRPHLEHIWNESNALLNQREKTEKVIERMQARVADGASLAQLRRPVRKIAEQIVAEGTTELEPLLDQLHPIVEDLVPGTTRREVMDLFSGYGQYKLLNKDRIKVIVRDLSGQAQQLGKIGDMLSGRAPKKTGVEQRTPSDTERSYIKRVEELKKRAGYTVTDPETQLRTARQAIKARLRNQIVDLANIIESGERPAGKAAVEWDADMDRLKAVRDRMKETLNDLEGDEVKPGVSSEQAEKNAVASVKRSLDEYNRRLEENDFSARGKKQGPKSAERAAVEAQRDVARAEYEELRELDEQVTRERAEKREQDLANQVAELERRLKAGEIDSAPRKRGEPSRTAEDLAEKRDALLKELGKLQREAKRPKLSDAEKEVLRAKRAEKAMTTRLTKSIAELNLKIANKDFTEKPQRSRPAMSPAVMRLKAEHERAKNDFERGLIKARLARRGTFDKTLDGAAKIRRSFVLTGYHTIFKLASAAVEIMAFRPVEQAAGALIGHLPGMSRIADKSQFRGKLRVRSEAKAIAETASNLGRDFWDYMRTGSTDLDAMFGKPHLHPFEWKEVFGRFHGALKTPARRNEWVRAQENGLAWLGERGVDITDPMVQLQVGTLAYGEANKSIFTEDNIIVDAYKRGMSRFTQKNRETGEVTVGQKVAETGLKILLPVIRIPTNIAARIAEYTFGSLLGTGRAALALRRGVETLQPHEADLIMQNLSRGAVGAAVFLLGLFNPQAIGGYYTGEGKRDEKDVEEGSIRVYGVNIPKVFIHNPLLEQLQIGATVRRVMDSKLHKSDKDPQGFWAGAIAAGLGMTRQVPFAELVARTGEAIQHHQKFSEYLEQTVTSMIVPAAVQDAAKLSDIDPATGKPTARKPENFGQRIKAVVPGLRTEVPKKKETRRRSVSAGSR